MNEPKDTYVLPDDSDFFAKEEPEKVIKEITKQLGYLVEAMTAHIDSKFEKMVVVTEALRAVGRPYKKEIEKILNEEN